MDLGCQRVVDVVYQGRSGVRMLVTSLGRLGIDVCLGSELVDLRRDVSVVECLLAVWNEGASVCLRCCQTVKLGEVGGNLTGLPHLVALQGIKIVVLTTVLLVDLELVLNLLVILIVAVLGDLMQRSD